MLERLPKHTYGKYHHLSKPNPTNPSNPNHNTEARKHEMPIVAENPGSVLNWKYEAECGVRASGFPYAVVRATGARSAV